MQYMLHISQDNIKTTQDRARFYADHNMQPRIFNPGQKVFLCVPHNSETLSTKRGIEKIKQDEMQANGQPSVK